MTKFIKQYSPLSSKPILSVKDKKSWHSHLNVSLLLVPLPPNFSSECSLLHKGFLRVFPTPVLSVIYMFNFELFLIMN